MIGMLENHLRVVSVERVAGVSELPQGKKRFVGMVGENFDMFCRGWHVGNRDSSMMRLRHKVVIGQCHVDGRGRGSRRNILNRSVQRPGVGGTTTIDGRVIICRVRRTENI